MNPADFTAAEPRKGRPPLLTPERDREVYDRYALWLANTPVKIRADLGISEHVLRSALAREQRRRRTVSSNRRAGMGV